MEIWEILDEKGNKTGKTIERGKIIPEGFYHLGADVWIMNSKGEILIQKRSAAKRKSPNVWAMTGGSVIKGETSLEAIKREVLEELGVQLDANNLKLVKQYKTGTVWLDVYFLRQEIDLKDIVMQEDEVSDVKWASYEEIENIFNDGQFMKNRWEYIRDIIKEKI